MIEAWLVGGPADNTTMHHVLADTRELLILGNSRYVRRPGGDVEVPRNNRDFATDPKYVFAAYFDFTPEGL